MHKKNVAGSNKIAVIIISCVIFAAIAVAGLFLMQKATGPVEKNLSEKVYVPTKSKPVSVIDYNNLEKDKELQILTQKRKTKYGVEKGVDIIVKSDESLKVGDLIVPMQEILDKIRINSGDIVEKDIGGLNLPDGRTKAFGIYVVKPEDNIWDIHFKFLKDYFDHKGITLAPVADEPDRKGFSSGIGKILKFSEKTVNIYNIKERKIAVDLNLIYPLSKVVVYNMDRIFALLDQIDYNNANHIQFDGETLWIHIDQ
ncbi:MAG: hypothetical protein KJ550_07560 [Proteobacteria bacterium]|nr:hypothetical protein [Desulfobacteraceae bacterium]MBU2521982.1 hypothetical protein [Pseudomonadota bacterium]MBU3980546.1 hypothetical protein [Pseudomonadota bacterium]MBU4013307.1 hypothetical protein [Pseudomonadota bacterium]MBU4066830.1 hypothetical protein [Pseudomonadota bacterium]